MHGLIGRLVLVALLFGCDAGEESAKIEVPDASASLEDAQDGANQDSVELGLSLLNERRIAAGVAPVESDPELTKGCLEHVRYMAANQTLIHEQDKSSPYWSKAGEKAGENGNIASNINGLNEAVDLWLWSIYNRLTLLDPGTAAVGAAFEYGYACLDSVSAWTVTEGHDPVPYPFHGQQDVPLDYVNLGALDPVPAEIEKPTGPIISLLFAPDALLNPEFSVVLVEEQTSTQVEIFVRLPKDETDPYATFQRNAVTAVPLAPLKPNTTYRVTMSGAVNENIFEKQWLFITTATPLSTPQ